jgi:radical SAM superfamily enzyme YgiQ (UPF0313 family)
MYKNVHCRIRPTDEITREIAWAGKRFPDESRVFLADADAMALPYGSLREILESLNFSFPKLARVNVYANGSSIQAKSSAELRELRRLKLTTLYLGLETGDQKLLDSVCKDEPIDGMVDAVKTTQEIGFRCSVMVLLGLAGRSGAQVHAERTAMVLNRMQPRLLSFLRFVEVPGTRMFTGYETQSEYGAVTELHTILSLLDLKRTVLRANHSSNPVPLEGRLPQDRDRLIAHLDVLIHSGKLDRTGPGALPFWL